MAALSRHDSSSSPDETAPSRATAKGAAARRRGTNPPGPADRLEIAIVTSLREIDPDYLIALQRCESEERLRVVAFVSAPNAKTTESAQTLFPQAQPQPSLDAIGAAPGGLVLLTTPPHQHPVQASAAFKRGWHVLSVGPLATDAREAAAMVAASQRHERILAIDLHWRFFPAAQFVRSLCQDQLLGPMIDFRLHLADASTTAMIGMSRKDLPDGVLRTAGAIGVDLLLWSLGQPTVVNYADDAMGGVEANALLELSFPGGERGFIHLGGFSSLARASEFVFERGTVRWDVRDPNRVGVQLASAPAALQGMVVPALSAEAQAESPSALPTRADAIAAQIRHLVAALAGQEPLRIGAAESIGSLKVQDDCYARRTLLPQPWLTHNENARARALSAPEGGLRL